ncbi:putative nuclease HARBI1 [Zophobas morio]|uniref:putative nuclease HARBI1 n=1 Tax=Zophobas morio TaxID=2755281 RepID=UPI0030828960
MTGTAAAGSEEGGFAGGADDGEGEKGLKATPQGSYQNSIGQDYRSPMSQSSVSRSIHVVIDIIIDQFHHIIKFPRTVEEITVTKNRFFQRFQLPGVVGCIDCTHVPISGEALVLGNIDVPRLVFMNRKGYFSLNCQIICDSNLRILHMGARFPGSVHDAAIWQLSDIQVYLRRRFFNNNDETTWLLGDSAYPLTPYLLTPINGADPNTPEGRYTYAHRLARNSIERCIGVLKTAWRCLHKDRVLKYHPLFVAKIFYTCGILHNIMRMRNIEIEIDYDMHNELEVEDFNDADFNVQLLHLGRQRRNNVIQNNFL